MKATKQPPPDESGETLSRLRAGGQKALAEMFVLFQPRLLRMVQLRMDRRMAGRADAADVVQDAYLDASRRLQEYLDNPTMPLLLWLRFLTSQRLLATHRVHLEAKQRDARLELPDYRATHRPGVNSESLSFQFCGRFTSPSRAAMREETKTRVREFIGQLEPIDREILSLRHFEELTNSEAALELDISPAAASRRYIRALERLKSAVGSWADFAVM